MEDNDFRFDSSATARAYVRDVAYRFKDPELMLEFLSASDLAHAALVCWLFEENRADSTHRPGGSETEGPFHLSGSTAASAEFRLAIERLQKVISKLDAGDQDRFQS